MEKSYEAKSITYVRPDGSLGITTDGKTGHDGKPLPPADLAFLNFLFSGNGTLDDVVAAPLNGNAGTLASAVSAPQPTSAPKVLNRGLPRDFEPSSGYIILKKAGEAHHFIHTSLGNGGFHAAIDSFPDKRPPYAFAVVLDERVGHSPSGDRSGLEEQSIDFGDGPSGYQMVMFDFGRLLNAPLRDDVGRPFETYVHAVAFRKDSSWATLTPRQLRAEVAKQYLAATGKKDLGEAVALLHAQAQEVVCDPESVAKPELVNWLQALAKM